MAIVSHGAPELLRRCLRSFETTVDSKPRQVVVVDSGSPDETPEMVAREFPWVELIRRPNVGFAAANNLVLREPACEFVLLLNPDTELRDGALERCLARMDADPGIGMVGCKLVLPSGELDHACKALVSNPVVRSRPFHRGRPIRLGSGAAQPVPGDRTWARTSRARWTP